MTVRVLPWLLHDKDQGGTVAERGAAGYSLSEHREASDRYTKDAIVAVKAFQRIPAIEVAKKRRKQARAMRLAFHARYHDLIAQLLVEMGKDDDHQLSERMRRAIAMKAQGEVGRELGGT